MKHSAPYPPNWTFGPANNMGDGYIGINHRNHHSFAEVVIAMGDTAPDDPKNNALRANAQCILAASQLLEACQAQHEAIDRLFAMLIVARSDFLPSKCGQPWEALNLGQQAIALATEDTLP